MDNFIYKLSLFPALSNDNLYMTNDTDFQSDFAVYSLIIFSVPLLQYSPRGSLVVIHLQILLHFQ